MISFFCNYSFRKRTYLRIEVFECRSVEGEVKSFGLIAGDEMGMVFGGDRWNVRQYE